MDAARARAGIATTSEPGAGAPRDRAREGEMMEAAVFKGVGNPLSIEQVAEPAVRPGDLLIKVEYCGICGSDLHATEAGALVVPEGQILGHEFTGDGRRGGRGGRRRMDGRRPRDRGAGQRLCGVRPPVPARHGHPLPQQHHHRLRRAGGLRGVHPGRRRQRAAPAAGPGLPRGRDGGAALRRPSRDRQGGHAARHRRAGDRRRPHRPLVHDLRPLLRRPPRGGERVRREPARTRAGDGGHRGHRPRGRRRGRAVCGDRRRARPTS